MTDFINTAAQKETVLGDLLEDATVEGFNNMINERMNDIKNTLPPKKQNSTYVGAIIIQELIADKLKNLKTKIQNKDTRLDITIDQLDNRLSYFTSDVFIEGFLNKLPVRDKLNITVAQSSYTSFFNTLFNVSYSDWREDKLSKVDNQSQCRRALGLNASLKINYLQQIGIINCYLCGRNILPEESGQSTMECEHVLPILTALSHFWLIKGKATDYTKEELSALKMEYDWSHRCCNQIKSNYEFITYNKQKNIYVHTEELIKLLLNEIQKSNKYDCSNIKGAVTNNQYINVIRDKINPLLSIINNNLHKFDSVDEYILLTKFKLLSAFSKDDFINAVIGQGEILEIPKTRKQIIEEKKALIDLQIKTEIEAKAAQKKLQDELREFRANRHLSMYNDVNNLISRRQGGVVKKSNGGSNDDEIWELFEKEYKEHYPEEYYDIVDEFIDTEFPEIKNTISLKWYIPKKALELSDPEYILTNEAFNPTREEFQNKLNELFISPSPQINQVLVPIQTGTTIATQKRLRDSDIDVDYDANNNTEIQTRKFVRVRGGKSKQIRTRKSRKSRKTRKHKKK